MKTVSHLFVFFALALSVTAQTSAPVSSSPLKHIVIIFQENRTPDNLFYALCLPPYGTSASCSTSPSDTQYNIKMHNWLDKSVSGGTIEPQPEPLAIQYDMSHAHSGFTAECDADPATGKCKMDGAAGTGCTGTCLTQPQFRYVAAGQATPYMDLATQYGWANYMFQTNQGPSFPAHQFMFGGTSAPDAASDALGVYASENMSKSGVAGTSAVAGCTAPSDTVVQLITPSGENPKDQVYPCFQHKTMADLLTGSLELALLHAQRRLYLERSECHREPLSIHRAGRHMRRQGLD